MTTNVPRASESGHWYDRDGTPCYEVRAKDGTMRPATLRDARIYGWYPGVTSIIKCAAAPALERWKNEQTALAAITLPRIDGESGDALLRRIAKDAEAQAAKAAAWGTRFHAAIQGHFEGQAPDEEMWPFVKGVLECLAANFGEQDWRPELPRAHQLGFGTKIDLSVPAIVLDFKGKDFTKADLHDLKAWDQHAQQLAAGREALIQPQAETAIVYVSRTVAGLAKICRVDEPELVRGWDQFRALLNYWKATNRYYPELWKPAEKEAA